MKKLFIILFLFVVSIGNAQICDLHRNKKINNGIGITYSNRDEVGVAIKYRRNFFEYRTATFKGRQTNGKTYPNKDSFSFGYSVNIDSLVMVPTVNVCKIGNTTKLNWELKIRALNFNKVSLYTGFGSREITLTLIRKL